MHDEHRARNDYRCSLVRASTVASPRSEPRVAHDRVEVKKRVHVCMRKRDTKLGVERIYMLDVAARRTHRTANRKSIEEGRDGARSRINDGGEERAEERGWKKSCTWHRSSRPSMRGVLSL
jgi:hypothetical protein